LEVVRRVGADIAIDYRGEDWVERVKEVTDGHGADVIYDSVGGEITDASLKCIAWNGRLLVIGFASGRIPEVKLNRVLLKNISLVGLHWGAHAMHEPARIDETFRALFGLYAQGAVEPVIYRRYPLEQLPAALEALGSRRSYGKDVVAPEVGFHAGAGRARGLPVGHRHRGASGGGQQLEERLGGEGAHTGGTGPEAQC